MNHTQKAAAEMWQLFECNFGGNHGTYHHDNLYCTDYSADYTYNDNIFSKCSIDFFRGIFSNTSPRLSCILSVYIIFMLKEGTKHDKRMNG